ncbi:hypothetical protein AB0C27_21900 [Nonomuraea sp. NPDC048882]|uniref:hypothetical protein n=1 Tax=unclassified Nonomuraea TaxID=2593643 RepID=UPI0033C7226C
MRKHRPVGTHPVDYIEAVIDGLRTLGMRTIRSGTQKIWLDWPHAEYTHLTWDEEFGWTIEITEDTSHGFTHVRYGLPLDLNAEPADVALTVRIMRFEPGKLPLESPRRKRWP